MSGKNENRQIIDAVPTSLAQQNAAVRMEPGQLMTAAQMRPRDIVAIVKECEKEINEFPDFAQVLLYCKPVGRKADVCRKCGAEVRRERGGRAQRCECGSTDIQEGPMQFHTDLSVRMAEWIVPKLGWLSAVSEQCSTSSDEVMATVTVTDFQTGVVLQDSRRVSRIAKGYRGSTYEIPAEKFDQMIVPAQQSKLWRNLILRICPIVLKYRIRDMAAKATEDLLTPDAIKKIEAWFLEKHAIPLERIEALFGKPASRWTKAERERLLQIQNAIRNGDEALESYFPTIATTATETGNGTGQGDGPSTGTADALLKGNGSAPAEKVKQEETEEKPADKPKAREPKEVVDHSNDDIPFDPDKDAPKADPAGLSPIAAKLLEEIQEGFDGDQSIADAVAKQMIKRHSKGEIRTAELTQLMKAHETQCAAEKLNPPKLA